MRESWLIEDRWWTDRPLRRRYWEVVTVDGRDLVVFRELREGHWYPPSLILRTLGAIARCPVTRAARPSRDALRPRPGDGRVPRRRAARRARLRRHRGDRRPRPTARDIARGRPARGHRALCIVCRRRLRSRPRALPGHDASPRARARRCASRSAPRPPTTCSLEEERSDGTCRADARRGARGRRRGDAGRTGHAAARGDRAGRRRSRRAPRPRARGQWPHVDRPAGAARRRAARPALRAHFRAAPARDLSAAASLDREEPARAPGAVGDVRRRGWQVSADGSIGRGGASLIAGLSAEDVAGSLADRATGRRTLSITRRNALEGSGAAGA